MEVSKVNSLVELFFKKLEEVDNKKPLLYSLKSEKKIYNWNEVSECIFRLTNKIKKLIKFGDKCLILSENNPNWFISDISVMNAGGISVPIFTTYSANDYKYILKDCKPTLVIVSNNSQFKKIKEFINHKETTIISFEKLDTNSYLITDIFKDTLNERLVNNSLKRNMPACIIYTSGTSGNPKGVILSHGGILANCEGAYDLLLPLIKKTSPVFLTWLPLSHSYEHTVQFVQILIGAEIFYAESLEKLLTNMSEAKPTIMTAVPRFYQNLFNKINVNFKKQKGFKRKLIDLTIEIGTKKLKKTKLKYYEIIIDFICEKLVRKKIKKQFGGKLQAFVSGGGALDQKIGEFLNSIGLPTLQGYGLTEASPVVSCNIPGKIQVETVGPPFKNEFSENCRRWGNFD